MLAESTHFRRILYWKRLILAKEMTCFYVAIMRVLALIAFVAVQLSVFTCGFDIHVHAMDVDNSHVAEHLHDENSKHDQGSVNHGCHIHASHTFTASHDKYVKNVPFVSVEQDYVLSESNLKKIPFLIEYPPKFIRS